MKRFNVKKILAVVMSVVLMAQFALSTAADTVVTYISDIRLFSADSESGAKQDAADMGYTVFDHDLNQGTGKKWILLGYKTTTDPSKAVTDIKIMNTNGGYIVDDSAAEIQKMYDDMKAEAQYMMGVVEAYRDTANSGSEYAEAARTALNAFTYSREIGGTEHPLGDFLLTDANVDDLVQLIYFADQHIPWTMFQYLSLGILPSGYTSWMDRTVENLNDPG